MSLTLRPLSMVDKQAWLVLWEGYLDKSYSAFSPEITDTTFSRLVDPERRNQQAVVAEDNGELLGFAHIIYHPHTWYMTDVCYLQDLYTAPKARGKGVATSLIKAVYRHADANEASSVYWTTRESNREARRIYDKLGELTTSIKYRRSKA